MGTIRLANTCFDLAVEPDAGALCHNLVWHSRAGTVELLLTRPSDAGSYLDKMPLFGAFPMVPFANRLKPARLPGGEVHFPENWPREACAIHGTGWMAEWDVAESSGSGLTMRHRARDQSGTFDCWATLGIQLREASVEFDMRISNNTHLAVPVGLGLHPWFALTDDLLIDFEARWQSSVLPGFPSVVELNDKPLLSPAEDIDDCFAGWSGEARLVYPSQGFGIEIRADDVFNALQVFIHRERKTLCLEPVSHGPNAAHNERVAAIAPMYRLEPGTEFSGRIYLRPFETDRR
jgi:aldose 1-epimerase